MHAQCCECIYATSQTLFANSDHNWLQSEKKTKPSGGGQTDRVIRIEIPETPLYQPKKSFVESQFIDNDSFCDPTRKIDNEIFFF